MDRCRESGYVDVSVLLGLAQAGPEPVDLPDVGGMA
jgi:hypothetical protein